MAGFITEVAHRLGRQAEAVCRHYLAHGRRYGVYWCVGDKTNTPGRSLFVRLVDGPDGRQAGKWQDAATGEHGDLLDIIGASCHLHRLPDVLDEACAFLAMPHRALRTGVPEDFGTSGGTTAAFRLFSAAKPLKGTLGEAYLRERGLIGLKHTASLRFHSACDWFGEARQSQGSWPALLAAVTDPDGRLTGIQRTYLDPAGFNAQTLGKALLDAPRKSLGDLQGFGIRFGLADDVLAAGEGLETVLSLRVVMPDLPVVAATSSAHLVALILPARLRRLYIIQDNDAAGAAAARRLTARAEAKGIEAHTLYPQGNDLNDDLRHDGSQAVRTRLRGQVAGTDAARFLL